VSAEERISEERIGDTGDITIPEDGEDGEDDTGDTGDTGDTARGGESPNIGADGGATV
jgi:hypothetical protein